MAAEAELAELESDGRRPWWVSLIGLGFLAIGAMLIIAGGEISGLSEYPRSIFAHIGTAIALIGPLFVGERLLSIRVGEARDEASAARSAADRALETATEVRATIGDLDRDFRDRLEEIRLAGRQRRERAAEGGAQGDLVELYREAKGERWIDRRGLRIPTAIPEIWLLVRAVERTEDGVEIAFVELSFEGPKLEPVAETVIWAPEEPAAEMFVRLAEALTAGGRWPGDESFRPGELLQRIADALGRVIDVHTGSGGDRRVRQLVGFIGEDWAVTREGLDAVLLPDIFVERDQFSGAAERALERVAEQVRAEGLDEAAFRVAFAEAAAVHEGFRREERERIIRFGRKL